MGVFDNVFVSQDEFPLLSGPPPTPHFLAPGGAFDIQGLGGTEGVIGIIGGINTGVENLLSGLAQARSLRNQAAVHRTNATNVRIAGKLAVASQQRRGRVVMGTIRARAGAAGVDPNTGSAAQAVITAAEQSARNAEIIRWDYDSKVKALQYEASLARFNADIAKLKGIAGIIGAVGGAFGSAALLAGSPGGGGGNQAGEPNIALFEGLA